MASVAKTQWRWCSARDGEPLKILMFGATGQVAREVRRQAEVIALGRDDADLTRPEECRAAIEAHAPDAVINAAAYTAVDRAEEHEATAFLVNCEAPKAMAICCASRDIPFVTISTDYVFDGQGERPWKPDDLTGPLGAYGRTKLAGERAVLAAGGRCAVLRTSWVFSAHGNNFVKTMLRLGAERDALSIVSDQVGGPTSADAIAQACLRMARMLADDSELAGIYHFSGTPDVSWDIFATAIFEQAGLDCAVTPISSAEYPTAAARPMNSRLDCTSLERAFDIPRPDWLKSLASVLAEL